MPNDTIQPDTTLPKPTAVKTYQAKLTATGTNDPTVIEYQNTLGSTITWTHSGTGEYLGTATKDIFTEETTFIQTTNGIITEKTLPYVAAATAIGISNVDAMGGIDGLSNVYIQIQIHYPPGTVTND